MASQLRLTRRPVTSIAALITALAPAVAGAVGLGQIEAVSALNQPFNGRIELLDVTASEIDSLTVRLADSAQFERAGIARTAAILQLDLRIQQDARGREYILVTTREPFREPFLNFLLELNWANGRLVREYTVLLDPPAAVTRQQEMRAGGAETAEAPATREPSVQQRPAQATPVWSSGNEYGPTRTGDTLWSIAASVRPDSSISVHQMMMALLHTNPHAFINGNINVLRQGAVLRVPAREDIALSASEAIAEVQQQNEIWQSNRQTASAAPAAQPASESARNVRDVVDAAEPPTGQPRLDIVAPREGGGGREPSSVAVREGETGLLEERLAAIEQEASDLKEKLSESEEIIDLLQRQIDIKDNELAVLQQRSGEDRESPAATRQVSEQPAEQPKPEPRTPVAAEPKSLAPPPAASSGLLDRIPGGIASVGAVSAALLLLAGWFGMRRRREGEATAPLQRTVIAGAATAAPPALPKGDLFERAQPPAAEAIAKAETTIVEQSPADLLATIEAEQEALTQAAPVEDPLEEVNVYLAYERFDQAEQLVRSAIAKYPNEHNYKLRLLEVFYSANDPRKYEQAARELRDSVGESGPLWESALAMWNEMSPNRKLFDDGAEFSTMILAPGAMQTFVDLTAGDSGTAETPLTERTLVGLSPLAEGPVAANDAPIDQLAKEKGELAVDENEMFDFSATMEDDLIDLTAPSPSAEQPSEFIDLTDGGGVVQTETLFDVSGPIEDAESLTIGDDLLDITGGDHPEDELPSVDLSDTSDLLDVTRSGDLAGAEGLEPLNVTSPGDAASKAETLLDLTRGHLEDTQEGSDRQLLVPDMLDFAAPQEGTSAVLADTNVSAAPEPELALDFDISSPQIIDSNDVDSDEFDLALETTGDLEDLVGATKREPDDALAFDLDLVVDDVAEAETVARTPVEPATTASPSKSAAAIDLTVADQDFEELLGDAKQSMQSLQLEGEDLEFDLSLEDTGELSALRGTDIEIPGADDADSLGLNVDETLADLASSMEDTVSGLEESEDDLERSLDLGSRIESDVFQTTVSQSDATAIADVAPSLSDADEIDTKLNLATAYVELGDADGARAILDEVVADGSEAQKTAARRLLDQLASR